MKQEVEYLDLGVISYDKAWEYQTQLHKNLISAKLEARDLNTEYNPNKHYLLLCEHEPVFTIGKSGKMEHLLIDQKSLNSKGYNFYKSNRGGDITYHGPGQITGYPIFDLDFFQRDVHLYVRNIEEVIIRVLKHFGIEGIRVKDKTGVWIDGDIKKKICAIGVHMSRWVTLHGFALNVNTNLKDFDYIIPCGIKV